MNMRDILRHLMNGSTTWTQNKVASRIGLSSQAMSNRMNAKDVKAGFAVEVLETLGYQLVVVPPESKLPQGSIVVER